MAEKPQPEPVPTDEPPPHPAEPLQIDTPVIDMNPALIARPFAQDDEDALLALEQIEKSFRGPLPGRMTT